MRTNLYLYNRISRIFITPCYIGNKELYSKEQEQVYNRNGWETEEIRKWIDEDRDLEKIMTQRKEDNMQIQIIDNKIRNAKHNTRYKQIGRKDGRVKYMEKESLEQERIEDEMRERERAIMKLRNAEIQKKQTDIGKERKKKDTGFFEQISQNITLKNVLRLVIGSRIQEQRKKKDQRNYAMRSQNIIKERLY